MKALDGKINAGWWMTGTSVWICEMSGFCWCHLASKSTRLAVSLTCLWCPSCSTNFKRSYMVFVISGILAGGIPGFGIELCCFLHPLNWPLFLARLFVLCFLGPLLSWHTSCHHEWTEMIRSYRLLQLSVSPMNWHLSRHCFCCMGCFLFGLCVFVFLFFVGFWCLVLCCFGLLFGDDLWQ